MDATAGYGDGAGVDGYEEARGRGPSQNGGGEADQEEAEDDDDDDDDDDGDDDEATRRKKALSQSAADPRRFLKAKFQVGSTHGRMHYSLNERVFHHSDVPEPAKKARKEVLEMLNPHHRSTTPKWNRSTYNGAKSGRNVAPWDSDGRDDRYFRQLETEDYVRKAALKIAKSRMVEDDPDAINPKWNTSRVLPPEPSRTLATLPHDQDEVDRLKMQTLRKVNRRVYKSLVQRQNDFIQQMRKEREQREAAERARKWTHRELEQRGWNEYPDDVAMSMETRKLERKLETTMRVRRERRTRKHAQQQQQQQQGDDGKHNNGDFDDHGDIDDDDDNDDDLSTAALQRSEKEMRTMIARELEATYTKDALAEYLTIMEQQQEEARKRRERQERVRQRKAAKVPYNPRDAAWIEKKNKNRNKNKTSSATTTTTTSTTARATSATIRRLRKDAVDIATSEERTEQKPLVQYEHRGKWQIIPFEQEWAWSCCGNYERDSRGCSAIVVAKPQRWNYT